MDLAGNQARVVDRAESLVSERHLLPFVEQAQRQNRWDESEQLLFTVLRHTTRIDRTHHARLRLLLARGHTEAALEEAALVFALYREQGRFIQALQVGRAMRRIDPHSARPYNLEMEYLLDMGCQQQAEECQQQLLQMLKTSGQSHEVQSSNVRFQLLLRRPQQRQRPRLPRSWNVSPPLPGGTGSNLPALLDHEMEQLWWNDEGDESRF